MTATQSSQLLPSLFAPFEADERFTVLHIGPALPETVEFFSAYRCKLYFTDLFAELPIREEEDGPSFARQFDELLGFPEDIRFDVCLFWDLFNFLGREAIAAFITALRPHLNPGALGHSFGVYNLKSAPANQLYAINQVDALTLRERRQALPGYSPHPQSKLQEMLDCFQIDRSVLLAESRLELLLRAKVA